MKQVEEYFKTYAANDCYSTADGFVFHEKGDAQLHAQSLKDHTVTPHSRFKTAPVIEHVVTEADLTNNPDLAAQGVAAGDAIEINPAPAKAPKAPKAPKAAKKQ